MRKVGLFTVTYGLVASCHLVRRAAEAHGGTRATDRARSTRMGCSCPDWVPSMPQSGARTCSRSARTRSPARQGEAPKRLFALWGYAPRYSEVSECAAHGRVGRAPSEAAARVGWRDRVTLHLSPLKRQKFAHRPTCTTQRQRLHRSNGRAVLAVGRKPPPSSSRSGQRQARLGYLVALRCPPRLAQRQEPSCGTSCRRSLSSIIPYP